MLKTNGRSLPTGKLGSDVKGKARGSLASANCSGDVPGAGCRKYEWLAEEKPSRLGNVREQNGESCCNWETWIWRMGLNGWSSFCQVSTKAFFSVKLRENKFFRKRKDPKTEANLFGAKTASWGCVSCFFFNWQGLRESDIVVDEVSSAKSTLISFKGLISLGNG